MFLFLRSLFLSVFLYVTITPYSLLTSAGVMSPLSYLNLPIFKCWISSCANVVSASPHLAVASLPTHLMSSAFSPSSHPPSLFTSQFDSSASSFPVLLFSSLTLRYTYPLTVFALKNVQVSHRTKSACVYKSSDLNPILYYFPPPHRKLINT